jgi:hypothetical protein
VQMKVERLRGQGPYLTHTLSGALASTGNATNNPSRQTIVLIIKLESDTTAIPQFRKEPT